MIFLNEEIKEWRRGPDGRLVEKAFLIGDNNARKIKLIREFAELNSRLREIYNESMEIKLMSDTPVRKLQYRFFVKLEEPTRKEIDRLLKLGIIKERRS